MDDPPSSLQPLSSSNCHKPNSTVDPISKTPNPTPQNPPPNSNPSTSTTTNKKNKKPITNISTTSSISSCSQSWQKGIRVLSKRRKNPRILMGSGVGSSRIDLEAVALPLGMSIAAVVAQVLERRDAPGEVMSADHLSMICSLAVRESLANVFGDRFDSFVSNFEKSFASTLSTLRLINASSSHENEDRETTSSSEVAHPIRGGFASSSAYGNGFHSEAVLSTSEDIQENTQTASISQELISHGQIDRELASASRNNSNSVLSTFEKSLAEQARSNDLKTFEISLMMRKLKLKETQLALDSDSNLIERFKLSMGISKASFKADKFKTQLEDTRHAELLRKCIDCLVAGLVIMSLALIYGAYVYSYERITEATASCTPLKESKSWWVPKPMASFSSVLQIIRCQVEAISRMLFGFFMILAIAYLLIQRSGTSKQTMPITFILLLLGIACGFAGKLCVDTLGGSGYHWLVYWEILCALHFFSNIFTSPLFCILHGPISVTQETRAKVIFPYWVRRVLFYGIMLLFLPLFCGLMPFAGPFEWKDHFSVLLAGTIGDVD